MSVNSSSSSNASLPASSLSSSIGTHWFLYNCLISTLGTISTTVFTIASVLVLLPLCIFVLYLGQQRWRQRRCDTTTSHSDVITYHMVVIELIGVLGSIVLCCGILTNVPQIMMVGNYLFFISLYGQMSFHILTCVERYVAVVHPITYLSLRKAKWIRIRNITIGCVWLLSFAGTSIMADHVLPIIMSACALAFALTVVSFCSLSVLCVLIRPGPGEGGVGRQQVDQSKLRAFYTITAILGVLLVRLGGCILTSALYALPQLGETGRCSLWLSVIWCCLPSSLVLPLLFLQRAGKLQCCKNNK